MQTWRLSLLRFRLEAKLNVLRRSYPVRKPNRGNHTQQHKKQGCESIQIAGRKASLSMPLHVILIDTIRLSLSEHLELLVIKASTTSDSQFFATCSGEVSNRSDRELLRRREAF